MLRDLAILKESVCNVDNIGIILYMLGSIKVLIGRDDMRDYRGARVKRIIVTIIERISSTS